MRILLLHGRKTVDEDMDGWGFDGGYIEGVEAVHITYDGAPNVFFVSHEACEQAKARTGWKDWDDKALQAKVSDGMLHLAHGSDDGSEAFFGDWEFQNDATPAQGGAA